MPLPRRRSSFLGQQAPSSATESVGGPGRRVSVGSLSRPPGVYVGAVPTGGVSSLGTRVSRRALGISSVFLQGLRSSCSAVPLAAGLEKGRGLSYESLNGCLVEYIEKVRALEQVNQELEEHIRVYLDKKSSSVGSWGALRESWEAVYHQVGEAVLENARLMLHTENIQASAEDFKDRYENEQPFRKAVEDEINSLYKVIDDANLTKMDLESQIESMKEELTLLSKTHEEDVKVLYKQLAGSQLEELDVPLGSGLDNILEKIRIHWERDIEKNRAEAGALLRTKQQAEATAAVRSQEEELVEGLRTEFHETACKIQSLQAETESLRTLKRGLENSLYDAKHWHEIELQNLGSVISKLEAEMAEIKAETEQQQRDRENLLTNKQQLEKDIAAYHCLLDGEQSRYTHLKHAWALWEENVTRAVLRFLKAGCWVVRFGEAAKGEEHPKSSHDEIPDMLDRTAFQHCHRRMKFKNTAEGPSAPLPCRQNVKLKSSCITWGLCLWLQTTHAVVSAFCLGYITPSLPLQLCSQNIKAVFLGKLPF
uniref:Beaded filament structural protein 2 n=1 Tax=Gallus gallus TaxID=9031 RepID=A0A8V0YZN1_CHICK